MLDSRRLGSGALALWLLPALLWVLQVAGHAAPLWLSRTLAVAAGLASAAWAAAWVRRAWRRPEGPLFAAVLVLALAFGFAGLGHEVGQGYYTDEGHYLHHAREVNAGEPFTRSFVYPHLTYYLGAFALWLAELFAAPVAWLARTLYGVDDAPAVPWLVLRWVTAALGALTVVPVFLLARRLAGPPAAGLAGALLVFSVHYQDGFQVNTCDVPSAFFATVCMALVGRLLEGESTRNYLLAGVASGLAAAAKYPAGVVAVAILAVWAVHRVASRRWEWGLPWAALASLGTFLALHPSLFVHPEAALFGPRGILFGVRQYAGGGWVGVQPASNALYYAGQLLADFRWPAVALALAGLFALHRPSGGIEGGILQGGVRRRLLVLAPFPVAFLALIGSMSMVVLRNLFPVIPTLAVFMGVAAAGLIRLAARWPRRRRLAAAAVAAVALAWPAAAAVRQTVALTRPSTRNVMAAWIRDHVPPGAGILKESYTPDFAPHEYLTLERRFAFRIPEEGYADPRFDYLLVAGSAYWRWLRPENADKPQGDWYRRAFATHRLVHRVEPGGWRRGPELRLYQLAERPARDSAELVP